MALIPRYKELLEQPNSSEYKEFKAFFTRLWGHLVRQEWEALQALVEGKRILCK